MSIILILDTAQVYGKIMNKSFKRTFQNIKENPQVAIAVIDRDKMDGYRFAGPAQIHTAGELFDQVAAQMQKAGIKAQAVITVSVEEIYSLKPGQAGERIA